MMFGTFENLVLGWRETVAVCQKSQKKLLFDVFTIIRWQCLQENSLLPPENIVDNELKLCYYET
jgi:hypothetical protein